MKKILFIHYGVFEKDRWGRTFPLAKAASKCGLETTLLTTDSKRGIFPRTIKKDGVRIVIFPDILPLSLLRRGYGFISFLLRLLHVVRYRYDYTYMDCGETPNAGWPGKVSQMRGAILMSEWGDLLGRGGFYDRKPWLFKVVYGWYYLWAEQYFRRSANYVIVLSSVMWNHAVDIGVKKSQLRIVPGGAIPDVIQYGYESKALFQLPENVITLGYIGIDEGELKDLLPLMKVLKEQPFRDRFRLVAFGDKLSDTLLQQYDLQDLIISCGWINYYQDYSQLQAVDFFVLIKSTNVKLDAMGWPNKLGDYLAVGRPVMITPYGDITSFIATYPHGFIRLETPVEDACRECLQNILLGNYDQKKMGQYSRWLSENVVSWESRVSTLLQEIGVNVVN